MSQWIDKSQICIMKFCTLEKYPSLCSLRHIDAPTKTWLLPPIPSATNRRRDFWKRSFDFMIVTYPLVITRSASPFYSLKSSPIIFHDDQYFLLEILWTPFGCHFYHFYYQYWKQNDFFFNSTHWVDFFIRHVVMYIRSLRWFSRIWEIV